MTSQRIILSALEGAIHAAIEQGLLPESVLDNAPRSHTFYLSNGDWIGFDEDDIAAIRAVTESDIAEKIEYYRRVLDTIDIDIAVLTN